MDDVTDALLGLKDCDSVTDAPEKNRRDDIKHVSPLLDAVSKHMASEVNTDITGKKKRKRFKKEVNVVNEIQSIHQMEMNAGSTGEVTAPANGILEASDSVTEAVLNLEKAEQPRLDDVPKENGSEVNKSMTKKKKPKKKVNDSDVIPSTHQIEMNVNSTEDLVEVKAPANGISGDLHLKDVPHLEIAEQPRLDVVPKEYGSEGILDTTKKKKRKKKVAVDSEIQCMQEMEKNMSSTENFVEVKTQLSDNVGAYSNTSDILPLKDVPHLEIAEQPRLDVVPKKYGSEGNLDTAKKKKRKKKVAVDSEIQCTQEMEKNMSSTENHVEVKTQLSDSLGAYNNTSDYNAVASNEPEKDLPNNDVPKKDLPIKDVAEKDLVNKDVPVKLSELELDVVSKDKASECRDFTKKKKENAIIEIQCLDEVVKNMGSTENHNEINAWISDNLVVSENASDMDTTKKKKQKKKVTVTHEGQCMNQTGMVMESTENLVEIKSQVNGNLGATDIASDCHVVNNDSEKNIPSKDILMEELLEQPKLDISKEIVSDTDTTKKKKRKKKVTVTTETQCKDHTGKNMTSTKNHMEIKARTIDDLGASDNIGDYHVVNLSDNDIPMQELSEQPKLEVSREKASTRGTDMTKKKRKKKVKAVENHAIQDIHQTEANANISENHMEINGYVINNESKKNLLDKDASTLEPVKQPELDVGLVVDASEETMGTKKKKKLKKKVNDLNDVQNMDQTLLNVVTTENVTAIIDQNNGTSEALHGVRDFYAVNEELEHNLVDKVLTSLPVSKHSNLALASTENPSENVDAKKKKKRRSKKANIMNDVPIMDQGIAVMKDEMDHTVVNSESERNLINGTVRPLPEHTKFDGVSTESALEGNIETKKRKSTETKKGNRKSTETKKRKIESTVAKKSTETQTRKSTETIKRMRSKHKEVKDINEVQSFTQKETERSVARRKNKLREMNPSDAMYKILFSDEEPVDAMFKILLPDPPTSLVHSVPCERQQRHHLYQVTEESDELENGIYELKNEKILPEGLGKLQKIVSANLIRRKLIVLDVNGLLADVVMPAPKDCRGDVHILRRAIFKRPFVDDFLNFCFQNFDVAIWSSRSKVIVDRIVDYILGSLKNKLLFCWNMSHATQTGSKTLDNIHKPLVCKELRKIWEDFEGYDESNTLLLDDSPYKALLNPLHTAIFPSSFHYVDKKDKSLGPGGDLRVYLEGLLSSDNVQSYVEQNPFGQAAINEMDPSWEFYSSVLQTVTSRSVTKLA